MTTTETHADVRSRTVARIPRPDGAREPLKVNVFERMQHTNSELVPLFPYYGPGAMVPGGAIFRGSDVDMGHFFHENTVDEILMVFGGRGSLVQTGQVIATPRLHGVNTFLRDPHDEKSFLVAVITQRQTDGDDQHEALIFRCRKCQEHLLRHEFTSNPDDPTHQRWPEFPTLTRSAEAAESFNADAARRTCPKCGHLNDPFPVDRWGWPQWRRQQATINDARQVLLERAAEELGE